MLNYQRVPSKDVDLVCKHDDFSCTCLMEFAFRWSKQRRTSKKTCRVVLIASPWSWGDSIDTSCTVGLFCCGSPVNHRLDSHLPHLYFLEKTCHIFQAYSNHLSQKLLWKMLVIFQGDNSFQKSRPVSTEVYSKSYGCEIIGKMMVHSSRSMDWFKGKFTGKPHI